MYVRAGRPAFARPYVGVHRSTSLMSSSLLLQQCSACLVRLTWIVFVMGGRWPYSWYFVGFCLKDLFNIARSINWLKVLMDCPRLPISSYVAIWSEMTISLTSLQKTLMLDERTHLGIRPKIVKPYCVNVNSLIRMAWASRTSNRWIWVSPALSSTSQYLWLQEIQITSMDW